MKPKVFLSHNKKDKIFIEKLANNLRYCSIDVWYDEWEIPPGESLRKKIFEDGIPSCDLFFVYLTENSIPSFWVQKELDSAFIHDSQLKNNFLSLFVDKNETREQLALDLKALNIPEFNENEYLVPFGKLITQIWKAYSSNQIKIQEQNNKIKILELENKLLKHKQNSSIDIKKIELSLTKKTYEFNDIEKNLLEILLELKNEFANGIFNHNLLKKIKDIFNVSPAEGYSQKITLFRSKYQLYHFTGELILLGLIENKSSNELELLYSLTKEGIEFIKNSG